MICAVYPGTFDPITLGHEDVLARAASLFDRVVMAVAASRKKEPLFTLDERVELARAVTGHLANVRVRPFRGLLGDFVRQCGARVIVRGVRTAGDFDYEFQMAGMNRSLVPEAESVFLIPDDRYRYVSSSIVREIASMGADPGAFVSPVVAAALRARFETPARS